MKVAEFNYNLPKDLIAQHPLEKRDESRLLVLDKDKKLIEHKIFRDILKYLNAGDCLVVNNTKVIPARLYGIKIEEQCKGQADIEFLLLKRLEKDIWEVLVKPGKKLKIGSIVEFGEGILKAEILDVFEDGNRKVRFEYDGIFNEILEQIGLMPLPPYIARQKPQYNASLNDTQNALHFGSDIKEKLDDRERYQTVYAKYEGSAAAPTAGLHFTTELLEEIRKKGVEIAEVTLHVGTGTFRPVKVDKIEDHIMHSEHFYISKEDSEKINRAKKAGKKIIACGTTSCRVLESVATDEGFVKEIEGETDIFIYPGYKFKCIDSLITNFHLPESTLIMLVSALAGKETIMKAYEEAVEEKYRFFSFGDAMLII